MDTICLVRRLRLAPLGLLLCVAPALAQLPNGQIRFGTRIVHHSDFDSSGSVTPGDRVAFETWLARDPGAECFPGTLAVRLASTIGLAIDEASWRELASAGLTRTACDCAGDAPGSWRLAFRGGEATDFRVRWEAEVTGTLPPVVTTQWRSDAGYLKNRVLFVSNRKPAPPGWVDELAWADWLAARAAQVARLEDAETNRALLLYVELRADSSAGGQFVDATSVHLGEPVDIGTAFVDPPAAPAGYGAVVVLETVVGNSVAGHSVDLEIDLLDPAVAAFRVDPAGIEIVGLAGELLEGGAVVDEPGRLSVRLPPGGSVTVRWRGTTAPFDAPVFTPAATVRVIGGSQAANLTFFPKAVVSQVPAAVAAADQLLARLAQVDPLTDPALVESMVSYLTVRGYQRLEPSDIGYDADGNGD